MPIHTYTNWNVRPSDAEEQIEPFRKYFFICEGANTETFYFRKLIDLRKTLNIHPLIDIRRFWTEVERVCPEYRKYRAWLKKEGTAVLESVTGISKE